MQLDPFVPIEKKELFTQDGMQSLGYSVRVKNGINEKTLLPSYYECGIVSKDYLLIPNEDVVDIAHKVSNGMNTDSYEWTEQKCLFNGRKFTYSMTLQTDDLRYTPEVKVGEPVGLGMLWQNTYDGTSSLNFMFFVNVLSCLNGQISSKFFNKFRFRHDKSSTDWEEQILKATSYLQHAPEQLNEFVSNASYLTEYKMDKWGLNTVRRSSIPTIGSNAWGNIMDKYLAARDYTAWGLMQSCTNEFWHKKNLTYNDLKNNEYCVTNLMALA